MNYDPDSCFDSIGNLQWSTLNAAEGLLTKYVVWLCRHAAELLHAAISLLQQQRNNVKVVAGLITLIRNNIIGNNIPFNYSKSITQVT